VKNYRELGREWMKEYNIKLTVICLMVLSFSSLNLQASQVLKSDHITGEALSGFTFNVQHAFTGFSYLYYDETHANRVIRVDLTSDEGSFVWQDASEGVVRAVIEVKNFRIKIAGSTLEYGTTYGADATMHLYLNIIGTPGSEINRIESIENILLAPGYFNKFCTAVDNPYARWAILPDETTFVGTDPPDPNIERRDTFVEAMQWLGHCCQPNCPDGRYNGSDILGKIKNQLEAHFVMGGLIADAIEACGRRGGCGAGGGVTPSAWILAFCFVIVLRIYKKRRNK